MKVLIVQSSEHVGRLWQKHLRRQGMDVSVTHTQDAAIRSINVEPPSVIVLDLVLRNGAALAISDYASFRVPNTQVIFVTNTSFFSDGSIFSLAANACAFVPQATPPSDLAAIVEHYATER